MAKGRIISRSISTSRKVNRLTDRAALLYTWSIAHTDDYGRIEGDAISIKAIVAPMRDYNLTQIEEDLDIIEKLGLITRYEAQGEKYLEITGFDNHQTFRPDRPRRAECPDNAGKFPSDIPTTYQRHTSDIPVGENRQRKSSQVKLSQVKSSNTLVQGREKKKVVASGEYPEAFEDVWKIYPRKTGKGSALKAWETLAPGAALTIKIGASIEAYKKTKQWLKDDGQFIPHLATFINQRRFDDEPEGTPGATPLGKYAGIGKKLEQ